jgi:hypothetical protein
MVTKNEENEEGGYANEKKVVGDRGFKPPTSTVCKRHKKKEKRKI